MSFGYTLDAMPPQFFDTMRNLLQMLDVEDVVLVAAAGNGAESVGTAVYLYPALFGESMPNMIVVAATDWEGRRAGFSNYSPFVATGTSYSAPQVAGLAGYFQALPTRWKDQLNKPANVKKLIQLFVRRFAIEGAYVDPTQRRPIIWNGQVGEHSCLFDYAPNEDWAQACPTIRGNLEDEPPNPGQPRDPCAAGQNGNPARRRRQDGGGGSCPLIPDDNGPGKNIDWEEGPSEPECTADDNCGGEPCTVYYCDPDPEIPHPPDYYDPKDPLSMFLCVGETITPGAFGDSVNYGHTVYEAGQCDGKSIGIGSITNFPEICDISNDNLSTNKCGAELTFLNEGLTFWDKCGFQLEMSGRKFTPCLLDKEDEDHPCSTRCDLIVHTGILLYELPLVCL